MKINIEQLILTICIVAASFYMASCSEEYMKPLESTEKAPQQVKLLNVVPEPGSVTIHYSLPKDEDLLYVKAVYTLNSGVEREVKASYYNNTMTLDGFFDTDEHDVKLYSYNKGEVASEPLIIKVKAKEHPIWEIRKSLEILPDFMGVKIKAINKTSSNVVANVFYKLDDSNEWNNLDGIYTSAALIDQTIRGLDTIPHKMGVVLRDRFLNYTDTIFQEIKPFFEIPLDKNRYKDNTLPGDTKQNEGSEGIKTLWDGNTDSSNRMMTLQPESGPAWITINLGQLAQLSRIKIWTYAEWMGDNKALYYYRGTPRLLEIWGSENPNPDGSWESWVLLGNYEVIKPSGLPYGQNSDEDDRKARAGFDFDFSPELPKVRYLRFKSIENWMGTTWLDMTEIQVYGDNR